MIRLKCARKERTREEEEEECAWKEWEEQAMIRLECVRKEHARKDVKRIEEFTSKRLCEMEEEVRARKVEEDERARNEQHEQDVERIEKFTRKRLRVMEEFCSKRLLEIGMDEEMYELMRVIQRRR